MSNTNTTMDAATRSAGDESGGSSGGSGGSGGSLPADGPDLAQLAERVEKLRAVERPRYRRLWAYCHNPMQPAAALAGQASGEDRPYRQAQEWGLPQRITGARAGAGDVFACEPVDAGARKEVVIENDIGWRVDTMVNYLFGKPLVIDSAAPDPTRRKLIGELLRQILAANGGILLFQQLALLGTVHGFVDVLVKLRPCGRANADALAGAAASAEGDDQPTDSPACGTSDLGQPPVTDVTDPANLPDGDLSSDQGAAGQQAGGAALQAGTAPRAERRKDSAPGRHGGPGLGDDAGTHPGASGNDSRDAAAMVTRLARLVRLEVVEPARALPFVSPTDYREVVAYGQCFEISAAGSPIREAAGGNGTQSWVQRLRRMATRASAPAALSSATDGQTTVVELITPTRWARYEQGRIVAQGKNSLGRIPLVHVQNTALPFQYSGGSDVEPLIPIQDELNTRLSDRANRITLQSFKMYLGKGIENFTSLPVAPGRMWMSDNENADVIEFGGDSSAPSEEAHIGDVREAMDKVSGVTPIAAGAVEGRIGHLTSAVALRVTLQALLAKTEKKRTTYGTAIEQMCELALAWLHRAGLFATTPDERRVELSWPSPIPENEMDKLQEAQIKARLGVPKEIVLRELGY